MAFQYTGALAQRLPFRHVSFAALSREREFGERFRVRRRYLFKANEVK
jgi:hypothetical protein